LVPFLFNGIEWPLNGVHESVSFSHLLATWLVITWLARHWLALHWLALHWLARAADWFWGTDWLWLFAVPVRNFSAFGLGFATFDGLGLVDGFGGWDFDGFFDFFAVWDLLGNPLGFVSSDLFADHFSFERWYTNGDLDLFFGWDLNGVLFSSVCFFHDRFWWANWCWHADWLARLANWFWHTLHWLACLFFAWVAGVVVAFVPLFTARRLAVSSEHVPDGLSESSSYFFFFAALVVIAWHGVRLLAWSGAWGWCWCARCFARGGHAGFHWCGTGLFHFTGLVHTATLV
jgi:hypothetical protein